MFKVGGLLFRNPEALGAYLKLNEGTTFVVEYVSSYMLGDPMEQ